MSSSQDLLEGSYHMFRGPQTVRNKSISSGRMKGLTSASMLCSCSFKSETLIWNATGHNANLVFDKLKR